jgi:hypothetical protein
MKKVSSQLIVACGLVVLLSIISQAVYTNSQNKLPLKDQEQSTVQARFFDSTTGYAIQPQNIVTSTELQQNRLQADENGSLSLRLTRGSNNLTVSDEGYQTLSTDIQVEPNPIQIEIMLDPLETPPELQEKFIASLLRSEAGTVIGYVVDENSGQPLADVTVSSSNGADKAVTNERGFFVLQIPVQNYNFEEPAAVEDILFEKPGYRAEERKHVEIFPNNAATFRIRLLPGEGRNVSTERRSRSRDALAFDQQLDKNKTSNLDEITSSDNSWDGESSQREPLSTIYQSSSAPLPATIRVGTNCDCRTCTKVEVMSLETYCKRVLPAEWRPTWNLNSLKAGAVAIRGYSVSFINNPISPTYDICSSTCCQAYTPTTYLATDKAVDQTRDVVLLDTNNRVVRSEYSAENNNTGNGDCKTAMNIDDSVCCGAPRNGHGRGMCQSGSERWAAGTKYGGGQNPFGTKDWVWILNHYYPNYNISTPPVITDITPLSYPFAGRQFRIRIRGGYFTPSNVRVVVVGPGCPNFGSCVVPNSVLTGVTNSQIERAPLTLARGSFAVYTQNGSAGQRSNAALLIIR